MQNTVFHTVFCKHLCNIFLFKPLFKQTRKHDNLCRVFIQFPKLKMFAKRDLISASLIFCIFFVMRSAYCLKMLIMSPGKEPRPPFRVNEGKGGCIQGRPHLTSSRACVSMRLRDRAGMQHILLPATGIPAGARRLGGCQLLSPLLLEECS